MWARAWSAPVGFAMLGMIACSTDPFPKPRGYFRIDIPEDHFKATATECPMRFEIPERMVMQQRQRTDTACWLNLRLDANKATIHLTYRQVQNNLRMLIGDAHEFKNKHGSMAVRIDSERIQRPDAHVYGVLFSVEGDVASPMQFYLTDSVQHFIYGSLYFHTKPNGDSLAPVSARLREDIRHLARTLEWQ